MNISAYILTRPSLISNTGFSIVLYNILVGKKNTVIFKKPYSEKSVS